MFFKHKIIFGFYSVRFYSPSYYPVDYLGFMDEGQQDCNGVPSNLAFTSAIRTGFVFQGNESIALSGGEIIWLYLNRKLVLQVNLLRHKSIWHEFYLLTVLAATDMCEY